MGLKQMEEKYEPKIVEAVIPVSEPDYGTDEFSENGFQPESSALPVAPEFPHPIPQFRIAKLVADENDEGFQPENDAIPDDWVLTGHSAVLAAPAFKLPIQTPVDVVIPAPADENDESFQPEPIVAPVFELPIPAHVLKQ